MMTKIDPTSVFWLSNAFNQIKHSFDSGKIAHGLLFAAPHNSGKRALALLITKSILCEKSSQTLAEACNQCKNCQLVEAGTHPDLSNVDCLVDAKGKQKQSIGIDQIRSLNQKLVETPQLGKWRLAIIFSVEKMTRGSFNALLKTLEEPGRDTIVILLTDSIHQVPATIRSRCQSITLKLSPQELLPWLINQTNCERQDAKEALERSNFAPFAALEYLSNGSKAIYRQMTEELDLVLATRKTPKSLVEDFSDDEAGLWRHLADYFRNVQLECLLGTNQTYQQVPSSSACDIYQNLVEMNRAQSAGSNLQTKLQLEGILTQWFEIGRKIVHYSNS